MNVVKVSDGLGNQMFQYAFAKRMQVIYHKRVYLDTRFINNEDRVKRGEKSIYLEKNDYREYGLNHFKITLPTAGNKICQKWEYINTRNVQEKMINSLAQNNLWLWRYCDEAKWLEHRLQLNQNCIPATYFSGYYFDLSYYDDIKKVLQKEFCLRTPIKLSKTLRYIMRNKNTVSVHIRKGDFTRLSFDISHKNYYPNAINLIKEKVENPIFLIFSDDIDWVKNNMIIDGDKIYISELGFYDYEELIIMKHCLHNIIANSTFSYWAAYLNSNADKIVICPKNWKTNIIPSDWIGLNR